MSKTSKTSKMSKTSNIFEILEASSSEKSVGEVPQKVNQPKDVFEYLFQYRKYPDYVIDSLFRENRYGATVAMYAAALGIEIPKHYYHDKNLIETRSGLTVYQLAKKYRHMDKLDKHWFPDRFNDFAWDGFERFESSW